MKQARKSRVQSVRKSVSSQNSQVQKMGAVSADSSTPSLELFYKHLLPLALIVIYFVAFRVVPSPIADIDAYYHIKMSYMIRTHGIMRTFPWLQFTIMNKPYVDMHFLYHLLNVPLTVFDLETAAKIAGAVWAIAAFIMFHLLLVRLRVPYAGMWTLALLAVSWNFIYRMNISRTPSASVLFQLLALQAFYERRWRLLAGVTFAFVWMYQLFIILLPIAVIFTVLAYFDNRKFEWRYVGFTTAAILAGMIINPYFPHVFRFFYEHAFLTGGNVSGIPQGKEWLPFESTYFVQCCWGAFGAIAVTGFLAMATGTRIAFDAQVAVSICGMAFLMYVKSRRFAEYFVPYAMLASALIWRDMVGAGAFRRWPRQWSRVAAAGLCAGIAVGAVVDWRKGVEELRRHIPATRYKAASAYIAQHSNEGDVVFASDWDDFPELFFHNTKNHYILGLDPNLLYLASKDRYNIWNAASSGQLPMPARALAQQFDAKYALADYMHKPFISQAATDPGMLLCYQDNNAVVWKIDPAMSERDRIEAEAVMPPAALQPPGTKWQIQNFTQTFGGPASRNRVVLAETNSISDYVELAIPAKQGGLHDVKIGYVKSADLGIVQWSCNGVACGEAVDCYNSGTPRASGLLELGRLNLHAGPNRFRATVTGANPKATGKKMAVDYIHLRPLSNDAATTAPG